MLVLVEQEEQELQHKLAWLVYQEDQAVRQEFCMLEELLVTTLLRLLTVIILPELLRERQVSEVPVELAVLAEHGLVEPLEQQVPQLLEELFMREVLLVTTEVFLY
jgi:hypothetical protein